MDKNIKKWIDKNININLEDKNVFITGSNSGIGLELLKNCAYLKANCFMLARNKEKAIKAKEEVLKEYPNAFIEIIELDLSNLKSIDKAFEIIKKYDCDYFINNAGVYRLNEQYVYKDVEITMGTNFIGTLYLNNKLNEYFKSLNHKVMNIFTTSITSKSSKIDYNDFYSLKSSNLIRRYGRSKLAINDLYFYYLEKYKDSNIKFSLIHPGATYTPLIIKAYKNKIFQFFASIFMKIFFHSPSKASLTGLYAMNTEENSFVGPKGFLEMSGYPSKTVFKRSSSYLKTIEKGNEIIREINLS